MIKLKTISMRNFMSVGNVTQALNLDGTGLTLVLGENLDMGGGASRNGVGKSTIVQAICYALFGAPLTNIRKDNLVNKTNNKNMFVTLDFEKGGNKYRIERGRKPAFIRFYVNDSSIGNEEEYEDEAHGEIRETQKEINSVINVSRELFKHIIALNTFTVPFLSLGAGDQRKLIEELLGVTQLSEKATLLKEREKKTKEKIIEEEYRIKGVLESNKKIQSNIDQLKIKSAGWKQNHDKELNSINKALLELSHIDISEEIEKHKKYALSLEFYHKTQKDVQDLYERRSLYYAAWDYHQFTKDDQEKHESKQKMIKAEIARREQEIESLEILKNNIKESTCPTCNQAWHDDGTQLRKIERDIENIKSGFFDGRSIKDLQDSLGEYKEKIFHGEIPKDWENPKDPSLNPTWGLEGTPDYGKPPKKEIIPKPQKEDVFYKSVDEAYQHQSNINELDVQKNQLLKQTNPYVDQAEQLKLALQDVSYDIVNQLVKLKEHQEFLHKILTSKDSFVRKKIIDQNLGYLNHRLSSYLEKLGLQHSVRFLNDLSVEITELGREFDFDNLSRGEKNRLILGLSWAFRDVYESLYDSWNLLFIDELIDNGIDQLGVENALVVLKNMGRDKNKDIFLISHRDDLISRVTNVMLVKKENGFTSFHEGEDVTEEE